MSTPNPTLSTGGLDGTALEATLRAQQLASSAARDDDSDGSDDENESFNVNTTKQSQQLTAYRSGISIHTFTSSPAVQLLHDTINGHICAISAQGECVIRSASDLTLVDSWRITTSDGTAVAVSAATLSGDDLIIGCISGTIQRWSFSNRTMLASWDDHKGKVSCLSIVASNLYSTAHDGYFLVRSLASGVIIHSFITCTCALVAMCIERPNLVYIGSWDGQVKRIDLGAHACTLVLKASASKESPIRALALSPSPAPPTKRKKKSASPEVIDTTPLVFVAHGHGEIKSWDMRTGKVIVDQYMGCGDVINTLQVIRGRLYAGGDDRCIRIFDIYTGTCIDTLTGHDNGLTSLTVIDDSLYTTGYDGQWRQYQLSHIESAIAAKLAKLEEGKRLAYEAYLKAKKAGKKKRRSKKSSKKGSKKGSKKKSSKKKKKQSAVEASNVAAAVAAASAAIGLNPNDFTQPDTKVLSSKKKPSSGGSKKRSSGKKKSSKKKKKSNESNGSEIKTSNERKNTTTNETTTTNITITTETYASAKTE